MSAPHSSHAASAKAREVPRIETARLLVTIPRVELAPRVVEFYEENRAHFAAWDPPRPTGFFTEGFWRDRIAKNHAEWQAEHALKMMIFPRDAPDAAVLGQLNFTQIVRGPFLACLLGYAVDVRHQGTGTMHEALAAAIAYVFDTMGLHRIMANHMPNNARSAALLKRIGFVNEGYAHEYLYIGDGEAAAWRDHVLTSLTNPSARPEAT